MAPCVFHVAFLGHAHPVLDLGECLFDGIEVGAVGRQEPEPGAGGIDGVEGTYSALPRTATLKHRKLWPYYDKSKCPSGDFMSRMNRLSGALS